MTMRKSLMAAVGVLGLFVVGCEEKKTTPPPAPKVTPKAPPAPTGATGVTGATVPTTPPPAPK